MSESIFLTIFYTIVGILLTAISTNPVLVGTVFVILFFLIVGTMDL